MKTFGQINNNTFFSDFENHFGYKISDTQILDLSLNEFF